MKKLVLLLAALTLVACSSTPKEETQPATPTENAAMQDDSADTTAVDATMEDSTEDATVEETTEAPAEDATVEETTEAPAEDATVEETTEAPAEDTTVEETEGTPYEISSGDTLSKIARDNGLTVEEIAEFNNISNPDLIYADTEIKIPTK